MPLQHRSKHPITPGSVVSWRLTLETLPTKPLQDGSYSKIMPVPFHDQCSENKGFVVWRAISGLRFSWNGRFVETEASVANVTQLWISPCNNPCLFHTFIGIVSECTSINFLQYKSLFWCQFLGKLTHIPLVPEIVKRAEQNGILIWLPHWPAGDRWGMEFSGLLQWCSGKCCFNGELRGHR